MKKIRAELFAARYVKYNCNGARALRSLGHRGCREVLWTTTWRLLRTVEVREALARLRKEMDMDALEVVARMSEMARVSLGDFLDRDGRVDLARARRRGKLHLIREYRVDTEERRSGEKDEPKVTVVKQHLKLYDALAALKTMMEYHGLLSDFLEIRRLPKDPQELRRFIKDRLPLLFETTDPKKKVH